MRLTLHTFLTLDGVMQAPAARTRTPTAGSSTAAGRSPTATRTSVPPMVGWFDHAGAFLLGRKTYEIFSGYWPQRHRPRRPHREQAQRAAEVRRLHARWLRRTGTTLAAGRRRRGRGRQAQGTAGR